MYFDLSERREMIVWPEYWEGSQLYGLNDLTQQNPIRCACAAEDYQNILDR
jgi:hypothetical protein